VGEGKSSETGGKEGGDSVIGRISPINTLTKTINLNLKCVSGKSGVQEVEKFGSLPIDVLESKKASEEWRRSCQSSEDAITLNSGKAAKINA
jgi:hypothetical protein